MPRAYILIMAFACAMVSCQQTPPPMVERANLIDTTLRDLNPNTNNFNELASSLDNPERENWQKPQVVISLLGDLSEKTVADIGAGTGYFSFRLAEKAEKVIAIDIDSLFLDYIDRRLAEGRQSSKLHIETRLTSPETPGLQPQEADIILFVNTYHLLENRSSYFTKVKPCLRQGGKVVIIDFTQGQMPVGPPEEDRIPFLQASQELKLAGFNNIQVDTTSLDYQYILTAK